MTRLLPLFLLLSVLTACGDDDGEPMINSTAPPRIEVRLTDAPADYEQVVVDVADVEFRYAGGDTRRADETFAGTYDLLDLSNGLDTLIATAEVPAGELEEVRLILGQDNYLVTDSERIELRTPSAQQSGLKIKLEDVELRPGRVYVLLLDFDAGRSVVRAGNSGNYNLKPVIRATLRELDDPLTARITGTLDPAEQQYVFAYQTTGDTIGSFADTTGAFQLTSVPAGQYTVEIVPPDSADYAVTVITDVLVVAGQVTDLGTVNLR